MNYGMISITCSGGVYPRLESGAAIGRALICEFSCRANFFRSCQTSK
ncbi:hypothetical protein D1AOALGA4SA_9124 [Olavius algarvensis Delta 1 endosymbiont]|nr:hypothetical protein D1AOALGA4SA_9124 [Olavius algarvensis Delta 1 endosymbiont]